MEINKWTFLLFSSPFDITTRTLADRAPTTPLGLIDENEREHLESIIEFSNDHHGTSSNILHSTAAFLCVSIWIIFHFHS